MHRKNANQVVLSLGSGQRSAFKRSGRIKDYTTLSNCNFFLSYWLAYLLEKKPPIALSRFIFSVEKKEKRERKKERNEEKKGLD